MKQKEFARQVVEKIKDFPNVIGLAVGGSWITNEIDEYSDLDLTLVTETMISDNKGKMLEFAEKIGNLLSGFTGEHVGEPRVLICLYDNPLLHVDIKFVTIEEFRERVEDPTVLWEKEKALTNVIESTKSEWPKLDLQWIENRFWTWVHYATLKIGRGEYFEALDFLSYLRVFVISPLLQLKNGQLPRGLRKVEFNFTNSNLNKLVETVPEYDIYSICSSLESLITLYLELRTELFSNSIKLHKKVQQKTMEYLKETKIKVLKNK